MADNNLTKASTSETLPVSGVEQPHTRGDNENDLATSSSGSSVKRPGDRIFEFLSTASATLITVMIVRLLPSSSGAPCRRSA